MLTEQEQREIEEEIGAVHGHHRAAVVEALKIVQRYRGWVSDDGIRDVAACLGLTTAEVDSVATFYNMLFRRQVGRHVIFVCDSVSCWITGYLAVLRHLRARWQLEPGMTTADGRFTLLPIACLGHCELAPVMRVDEDIHGNLTPEKVDDILNRYE